MFELRWLIRDEEKVLQYRTTIIVTDYSTEKHIPIQKFTEWEDVPIEIEE